MEEELLEAGSGLGSSRSPSPSDSLAGLLAALSVAALNEPLFLYEWTEGDGVRLPDRRTMDFLLDSLKQDTLTTGVLLPLTVRRLLISRKLLALGRQLTVSKLPLLLFGLGLLECRMLPPRLKLPSLFLQICFNHINHKW